MNRCLSHSTFSVKIYRCPCVWDCVWIRETWNLGNIFQDLLPCRFHVGKMLHAFVKLEEEMAPYSSILAWRIPRTEEPGRLQSTGSWRVRHDWTTEQAFTKWHQVVSWDEWQATEPGGSTQGSICSEPRQLRLTEAEGWAVGQHPGWEGPGLSHH